MCAWAGRAFSAAECDFNRVTSFRASAPTGGARNGANSIVSAGDSAGLKLRERDIVAN